MMFKKYFTPQEANQRLPLVKQIVGDILARARAAKDLVASGVGPSNRKQHEKLLREVEDLIEELQDLGCFYKDWNFEHGLVDFPAKIDGKEVLLCWRSDEADVCWYHSIEDGFPGRCRIPEHFLLDLEKFVKVDPTKTV